MDQNNRAPRFPNLGLNIPQPQQLDQPQPQLAQPSEADLSMAFHRSLGVLGHDYCGESWVIQQRHFLDSVALRTEIRNLQIQYANRYVDPHMRDAVLQASNRHYDAVILRDNAAMNNNQ
jgi:hypothetical protein